MYVYNFFKIGDKNLRESGSRDTLEDLLMSAIQHST